MKVEEKYIIELTLKEAESLNILLGSFTDVKKKELGLDEKDIENMRELWRCLPYREDED